tara:strand:+ start:836 stop:1051 length:216 start_codon:yes stop_codon:yes gene_type:complete
VRWRWRIYTFDLERHRQEDSLRQILRNHAIAIEKIKRGSKVDSSSHLLKEEEEREKEQEKKKEKEQKKKRN